ncbi:MAG: hypothetical protein J6Q65_00485 [Lentisphaeria bacterium]|nr:hypothetical protein [Lentisphaeria bacterium]
MKNRNASGDELSSGDRGFLNSHGARTVADSNIPVQDVPHERSRLIFLVLFWMLILIGLFFAFFE